MTSQVKIFTFFLVLATCLFSSAVFAATITICPSGCNYTNIQEGIDAAINGDFVSVSDGNYVETLDFKGKAITVQSINGPQNTFIDAAGNSYAVSFVSHEGNDSVLDGFTILGGYNGGISCYQSSPSILNNEITQNRWTGISLTGSAALIKNNKIYANTDGHGIILGASSARIDGNIITDHRWPGIRGSGNGASIVNNVLTRNGIGIILNGSDRSKIINNTIVKNAWAGIELQYSIGYIVNNIITENGSYGIWFNSGSTGTIAYNDVWSNVMLDYNSASPGVGDISEDPLFVDPANDDFSLQSVSPAVDTGKNTYNDIIGYLSHDIEGTSRPQDGDGLGAGTTGDGSDFDMGAYEYGVPVLEVQIDIKPGSFPNAIKISENGNVPVAIFSSPSFDAATIDIASLELNGGDVRLTKGKGYIYSFEDINYDNLPDLLVKFDRGDVQLELGDSTATVTGVTLDGTQISGSDSVKVIE